MTGRLKIALLVLFHAAAAPRAVAQCVATDADCLQRETQPAFERLRAASCVSTHPEKAVACRAGLERYRAEQRQRIHDKAMRFRDGAAGTLWLEGVPHRTETLDFTYALCSLPDASWKDGHRPSLCEEKALRELADVLRAVAPESHRITFNTTKLSTIPESSIIETLAPGLSFLVASDGDTEVQNYTRLYLRDTTAKPVAHHALAFPDTYRSTLTGSFRLAPIPRYRMGPLTLDRAKREITFLELGRVEGDCGTTLRYQFRHHTAELQSVRYGDCEQAPVPTPWRQVYAAPLTTVR